MIGALLLFADYAVTAALSAFDGMHYMGLQAGFSVKLGACASILILGFINYIGPRRAGAFATGFRQLGEPCASARGLAGLARARLWGGFQADLQLFDGAIGRLERFFAMSAEVVGGFLQLACRLV